MTDKPHWSHLRRGGGNNGFRCGRSYAHKGLKKPQMSANASLATGTADAVGKADDDDDDEWRSNEMPPAMNVRHLQVERAVILLAHMDGL